VDDIIQSDYYALLSRKLFVTPADIARVVNLSSGDNEVVVAIHTDPRQGTHITYTRPAKSLWDVGGDSQNHFVKDPRVSITRRDAPLPRSLAIAVGGALKHLLSERRPPMRTEEVIVDGWLVEFSVPGRGQERIRGLLTNYARGRKGQSLQRLTHLLQRYPQVNASERTKIAEEISIEATKIMRYPVKKV